MIIEIANLFINTVLNILKMDLITLTWIPLIIGITIFRILYSLAGMRD